MAFGLIITVDTFECLIEFKDEPGQVLGLFFKFDQPFEELSIAVNRDDLFSKSIDIML